MKRILFIALVAILAIGCSKDDDGGKDVSGNLVGKWLSTGSYYWENGKWQYEADSKLGDSWILTFYDNGTADVVEGGYPYGTKISYKKDGSKLTVGPAVYEIEKLTDSDLILKIDSEEKVAFTKNK